VMCTLLFSSVMSLLSYLRCVNNSKYWYILLLWAVAMTVSLELSFLVKLHAILYIFLIEKPIMLGTSSGLPM